MKSARCSARRERSTDRPASDLGHAPRSLYRASSKGHVEVVKLLVVVPGIDDNMADRNGCTPLGDVGRKPAAVGVVVPADSHCLDALNKEHTGRQQPRGAKDLTDRRLTLPEVRFPDVMGLNVQTRHAQSGSDAKRERHGELIVAAVDE